MATGNYVPGSDDVHIPTNGTVVRDDGTIEVHIPADALPPMVVRLMKSGQLGSRYELHRPEDVVFMMTVNDAIAGTTTTDEFATFFTPAMETHTVIEASPSISKNGWSFTRDMVPATGGGVFWETYEPLDYVGFIWRVDEKDDDITFVYLPAEVFPTTVGHVTFTVPLGTGVRDLYMPEDTDEETAEGLRAMADGAFAFFTAIADRNAFQTQQRQTYAPGSKPSKKAAKRAAGGGKKPVVNGRTVVTVNVHPRATQGAAKGTYTGSGGGKHSYMYWVGSFERNQWYPSEQVHKKVEVIGHFRGVKAPGAKKTVKRLNL